MKTALIDQRRDGTMRIGQVQSHPIGLADFQKIYEGVVAMDVDLTKLHWGQIPQGFQVWRTASGNIFAVQDE